MSNSRDSEDPNVMRLREQLAAAERVATLHRQLAAAEQKTELRAQVEAAEAEIKKIEDPSSSAAQGWPKYQLDKLGKAIFVLSILGFFFVHMGSVLSHINRANLIQDGMNGGTARTKMMNEIDSADSSIQTLAAAHILFSIAFGVCLIVWAWRATTNLDAAGLPHRWKRGWAIGGWFTPVMFLFVPYQVVSDAWKNAPGAQNRPGRNRLWLFGFIAYWLGIAANRIAGAAFADAINSSDLDGLYFGDIVWACGSGLTGAGVILTGMAIKKMSTRHMDLKLEGPLTRTL
jgi:hypothetical protein